MLAGGLKDTWADVGDVALADTFVGAPGAVTGGGPVQKFTFGAIQLFPFPSARCSWVMSSDPDCCVVALIGTRNSQPDPLLPFASCRSGQPVLQPG